MDPTQDLLILAASAAGVVVVTALAVWFVIKSTAVKLAPVALILAGFCLEIFLVKPQFYLQIGLQIYPNDVISLFVLLAAIGGFVYRPVPVHASPFLLWLAFGVTIFVSLADGIQAYGRAAGNEARPFFYLWVAGLYCCTVDFSEAELRRISRWCVWTAYALIGIAAYYWVAVEIGFVDRRGFLDADDDKYVFRPVAAHAALFVGMVGLVQTMAWLRGSGTRMTSLHAAILLAFTVIIQHRSVWIAVGLGLLVTFLLERRHLPRRFALLLAFTLVLTFALAVAGTTGALDDLVRRLVESARTMGDDVGTFSARVDGWVRLMSDWWSASASTQLFGYPFGTGYVRQYRGITIDWAPHNFYVDLLLRVGIVGAVFWLVSTLMAIAYGLRGECASEFEYLLRRGLGVTLLASMAYCIAYPSNSYLCAATGIALAGLIRQQRQQRIPGATTARPPSPSDLVGSSVKWRTDR
jgi:hypothetical protein